MKIMFVEYLLISQVAMIITYIDSIIPRDAKRNLNAKGCLF